MTLDFWTVVAVFCMALATYATRAGGYVIFRMTKPPPIVREMLAYIPGALFVSYVVPTLVAGGLQQWVGAAVSLAVVMTTRNLTVAILGGTGAAWLVWGWH